MALVVIFVSLLAIMFLGTTTAISLGIVPILTFWGAGQAENLAVIAQRMFSSVTGVTLLAIPFFLLMGNFMNEGGISKRLFSFAKVMVGHLPGGLACADIMACTIMAAMSGSAIASAAGLGMIAITEMDKAGYGRKFPAALTACAATLGPIIPPSITFVIFASLTGESVSDLFAAGVVPGIFLAVCMMIMSTIIAKKRGIPRTPKSTLKEKWGGLRQAFLPLMIPVIVLVGIFGGFFTTTEAAAIAALYSAILGIAVYKQVKIRDLPRIFWNTVEQIAKIMFVIAVAGFFQYVLMYLRIPQLAVRLISGITTNPYLILLVIIGVYLVLGCFLEGNAIILISIPIFVPVVQSFGYSLVQFAVVMAMAVDIGLITPPLGLNIFTVASISGEKILDVAKEALPLVVLMIMVTIVIAFVPWFTTTLPGIFK
jgi:C4-dicarboxylate transporter DctM subunit